MLGYFKLIKDIITGAHFRKKMIFNAKKGPSRYILKHLESIHSVKALSLALEIEEHRSLLEPVELDVTQLGKIIVLAPHIDDETIGCGGLLIQCRDRNVAAEVYYTTNSHSRNNEEIRRQECKHVLGQLKTPYSFSKLSNIDFITTTEHVDALADKLLSSKTDAVFYPWLFDQPVKHRYTNLLLYLAIKKYPELITRQFYGYQVHNTILANSYLSISEEMNEKFDLINEFQSQVSKVAYADFTKAKNLLNSKFIGHISSPEYFEVFHGTDAEEFIYWVERYYLTDLEALFRFDKTLVPQAKKILKRCLEN